ncbi:MAG: hypothetical protein JSV44_09765 [Candidatus Zixiibacteriota bacterium]|nr:MAG: hypothetical protein JSV44_09765 [candidate division Zixibacteria bacterium]
MSPRTETIAFVILVAISLYARINHLDADPPIDLAYSSAVYTDPAQYISFARNLVLWGDLNPLHDFRLVFFLKSAITLLSYLVFLVAGVGYVQANIVGLLFSFSTIMLYFFVLRRLAGNLAALFFLLFIAFDYNQIFFGRYPFLENSMNFFTALALAILVHSRRIIPAFLAGIFMGVGIFFSKMIGLIYILPFACFMLYEYFHDYRDKLGSFLRRYAVFWAGFLALAGLWFFWSYRPMTASVEGYLQEQALALYGSPDGLKSLDFFMYKYMTFGATSDLFQKMPAPALLAWGMILIFFYRACTREGWKNRLYGINPGMIFMIVLVIGSYGALMLWNYRPLRYQTMLIYPVCALAGILMANILTDRGPAVPLKMSKIFPALLYIWLLIPVFQVLVNALESSIKVSTYYKYDVLIYVLALLITLAVVVLKRYAPFIFRKPPAWAIMGFLTIALLVGTAPNIYRYIKWNSSVSVTSVAAAQDLATVVSPEAVISGPYAARLTQDNRLRNFIHMFGVANVDTAFFRRYPITHLLLDKANEESARQDYPGILDNSPFVTEYRITNRVIKLYRVAGATGNVTANSYHLSDFELFRYFRALNQGDSAQFYLQQYLEEYPQNLSANLAIGIDAFTMEKYSLSEIYLKRALQFSPTDFHLRFKMAVFYIGVFAETRDYFLAEQGIREAELARKYNPTSKFLAASIEKLYQIKDSVQVE